MSEATQNTGTASGQVYSEGGMDFLVTRKRRLVTVYAPLAVFTFVLLFPFYWMTITTFKANDDLYNYEKSSPFWVSNPTLAKQRKWRPFTRPRS